MYGSDVELVDRYQNTVYFGIPNFISEEDNLVLTINTRNKIYDILLKEGLLWAKKEKRILFLQ